jgi:probable HAF family extracellular repeat protein
MLLRYVRRLVNRLGRRPRPAPSKRPASRFLPRLEALEDRTVPATIIDLGTLNGGPPVIFVANGGINAFGQVVGNAEPPFVNHPVYPHAFLYSGGTMMDLGTLDGGGPFFSTSGATGINASGQVVGYSTYTSSTPAAHGFLYSGGAMTDLGTFMPSGINDSGLLVGSSTNTSGVSHAFLYSGGAMTDLGTLGGTNSYASGINASGQVIGQADTTSGAQHAFRTAANQPINPATDDLGTLGGTNSYAHGINAYGQVVGYSTTSSGASHAFLYSNGAIMDLGTLGGTDSSAFGINAYGQVVGSSTTSSGAGHPFLYSNGTMMDLNALIPAGSGWVLQSAEGINDAGQIVGMGLHNGIPAAYLLDLTPSFQWTGLGRDNLWNDDDNWLGGSAPTAGADLLFPSGAQQLTNVDNLGLSFHSVTVQGAGYNISGGPVSNLSLMVTGGLSVEQGASLELGQHPFGPADLFTVSGGLNVAAGATLEVSLSATLQVFGRGTVAGALYVPGTLEIHDSGSSFTVSGEYSQGSALYVPAGSTLTVSGTFDNYDGMGTLHDGSFHIGGTLQFAGADIRTNAAYITLNAPGAAITDLNGVNALAHFATNHGSFTVQDGCVFTLDTVLTNDGTFTVANNGTFTESNAFNQTQAGTLDILNGGTVTLTDGMSDGTVANDGSLTIAAGNSGFTQNGTYSQSSGGTLTVSGTLTLSGGGSSIGMITDNGTLVIGGVTGGTNPFVESGEYTQDPMTGTLIVRGNSTLILSGLFDNFNRLTDTLTGGTYNIAGTFQFNDAAVATNAATIVLDGMGMIVDQNSGDALTNFFGDNMGNFTLQNGAGLSLAGAFSNEGTLTVGGGGTFTQRSTYTQTGTLSILAGGTAQLQDGSDSGTLSDAGALIITANTGFTESGTFTQTGTLTVQAGGTLTFSNGHTQTGGTTVINGTLVAEVSLQGGTLSGTGTISGDLTNAAALSIGDASTTGTLTITGSYTQTAAGTLSVYLAAVGMSGELAVGGVATLDGTLDVRRAPDYTPRTNDTFVVLTCSPFQPGTFATLTGDGGLFTVSYYTYGEVTLVAN